MSYKVYKLAITCMPSSYEIKWRWCYLKGSVVFFSSIQRTLGGLLNIFLDGFWFLLGDRLCQFEVRVGEPTITSHAWVLHRLSYGTVCRFMGSVCCRLEMMFALDKASVRELPYRVAFCMTLLLGTLGSPIMPSLTEDLCHFLSLVSPVDSPHGSYQWFWPTLVFHALLPKVTSGGQCHQGNDVQIPVGWEQDLSVATVL